MLFSQCEDFILYFEHLYTFFTKKVKLHLPPIINISIYACFSACIFFFRIFFSNTVRLHCENKRQFSNDSLEKKSSLAKSDCADLFFYFFSVLVWLFLGTKHVVCYSTYLLTYIKTLTLFSLANYARERARE